MSLSDRRGAGRAQALDGLRGLAAGMVVFYHAILNNDLTLIPRVLTPGIQYSAGARDVATKLALILLNGHVAVYVFFVLSGCVLRLSLDKHAANPAGALGLKFFAVRLLRLYPPTIACLAIFYAISQMGIPGYPTYGFAAFLNNASLWKIAMHGPSSTIQAEVIAPPFIFAAYLLRRRFGLLGLVFAAIYATAAIETPMLVFGLPNMNIYLFAILAGMLIPEPGLKPLLAGSAMPAWACAAVLIFCRTFSSQDSISALIAMTAAAAALVALLVHGPHGSMTRFLERPLLQTFGRISFSFYLLNVPVLDLLWAYTNSRSWPRQHALEAGLIVGSLSILLTWPLAWAVERWVERPSITAGRRVWATFRPRPTASELSSIPA